MEGPAAWTRSRVPGARRTPPKSRAAAFSSYDGDLSLPLGLALGSPIFPSGCEGRNGRGPHLEGRQEPQLY